MHEFLAFAPLLIPIVLKLKNRSLLFAPLFLLTWFLLLPYFILLEMFAPDWGSRSFDLGAFGTVHALGSLIVLPLFSVLSVIGVLRKKSLSFKTKTLCLLLAGIGVLLVVGLLFGGMFPRLG